MDSKLSKNIAQYIQLVYSEKSKLVEIKSLQERKITACKKVGWDHEDAEVKKIIDLQDIKTRDSILEYICKNNSPEYMNLLTDAHLLLQLQELKLMPLTPDEDEEKLLKSYNLKTTMSLKSQELLDRMNIAYEQIFKGQNEIKEAKKKVMWKTLEDRIKQRDEIRLKAQQNVPQNQ